MKTHSRISLAAAIALGLAAASVQAEPVTYTIDPTHTDVIAQWNHFGYSNPTAHFGQVQGTITYDPDDVSASRVEVTLPLAGMNAYSADFDAHLRNEDFFEADTWPEATFKSTSVAAAGENRLKVTGDLTIKDTTREVVLDVTVNKIAPHPMSGQPTAGFDATAQILRSDFGLGLFAPHVSDEVRLRITTEASVPAGEAAGDDADGADDGEG